MKKNITRYVHRVLIVLVCIFFIGLIIGFFHTIKPLPSDVSYEGELHQISAADVEFLYDLTYRNESGERVIEQEIFPRVFSLVDKAERLIVIDAFLFNNDYQGKEKLVPLTTMLKDKLVERKRQNPSMTIIFITDEINNFYGSYLSDELENLIAENITVIVTDTTRLRDSNPIYSGFWRLGLQWFGTAGQGSIQHPLGNPSNNVTMRAFLKLLNTKANHRKVFIADTNDSFTTILTSANPHEASSLHSNIAFVVKRKLWRDALVSEQAVATFSGNPIPELSVFENSITNDSDGTEQYTAQLLTEGKIKKSLIRDIDSMSSGEEIDLAMFYLSDRDIVKSLKRAAARDVKLRVILDPNKDAFSREKNGIPNRQVGFELDEKGTSVRWYSTHGEQFHTKLIVLHKKNMTVVYGGSANYTRRNLNDLNLESVIRITAPRTSILTARIEAYFTRLWNNEHGKYTLHFYVY